MTVEKKIKGFVVLLFILGIYCYSTGVKSYDGVGDGFAGNIKVLVNMHNDTLKTIHVVESSDTPQIADEAFKKLIKGIIETQSLEVENVAGATYSSKGLKEAVASAVISSDANVKESFYAKEKEKNIMDEKKVDYNWSVQPQLGLVEGDYYKTKMKFRQGHIGTLEVVKNNGKIIMVEFNEITRSNYYNRYYQNADKRLSSYNFTMKEKSKAAWIEGVIAAEKWVLQNQKLQGDIDIVAGASNSIEQSFIPLGKELEKSLDKPSKIKYYGIAEKFQGGITGRLEVLIEDGKIIECKYDEIFADTEEEIEKFNEKKYYKQSKYHSIDYIEPSRIGFNSQMDALNERVVETQDLLNIKGLPATEETGDYKSKGYTVKNKSWDNYLVLAEKLKLKIKN